MNSTFLLGAFLLTPIAWVLICFALGRIMKSLDSDIDVSDDKIIEGIFLMSFFICMAAWGLGFILFAL